MADFRAFRPRKAEQPAAETVPANSRHSAPFDGHPPRFFRTGRPVLRGNGKGIPTGITILIIYHFPFKKSSREFAQNVFLSKTRGKPEKSRRGYHVKKRKHFMPAGPSPPPGLMPIVCICERLAPFPSSPSSRCSTSIRRSSRTNCGRWNARLQRAFRQP